jgi:hypothetical protein
MRRLVISFFVFIPFAALGCENGAPAPDEAGPAAAPAAADAGGQIPGTPPGGLEQWVEEIRTGLAGVPEQAAHDMAAAQKTTLDLYIGRQEYLELYYGEAGRYRATDALADAITADEAAFHRLLQLVNPAAAASVDTGQIRSALDTLNQRLDVVMEEARAAGIDLTRPVAPTT